MCSSDLSPLSTVLTTRHRGQRIALPSLRPDRWDWLEVREYLVLKFDGRTVRYPVQDGDVAQARLRAALSQRPNDEVVVVTDDAYFRVASTGKSFGRLRLNEPDVGNTL